MNRNLPASLVATKSRVVWIASTVLAIAIAILAAASWYYSDQLIRPRRGKAMEPDLQVIAVPNGRVLLPDRNGTRKPGTWVLEWPGGCGRVGSIRRRGQNIERDFQPLRGSLTPGTNARLNPFGFDEDPRTQFDLPYREVVVPSVNGGCPAWFLDGPGHTWLILVHGMGATRAEALRLLHETASLGLPSLVITYRSDPGAPGSQDGLLHLGMTEWEDLDRAVEYSRLAGARDVVLVGYSTGGAVIARFLLKSARAGSVRGVILEAPVLDWYAATAHYARHHRIPALLATLGTRLAGWRAGIEWGGLEPLAQAKRLRAPMLVIHGTADPVVPLWTSESLAVRRPDLVTLIKIPGAGHVESWNADSTAYGTNVREWLHRVGAED